MVTDIVEFTDSNNNMFSIQEVSDGTIEIFVDSYTGYMAYIRVNPGDLREMNRQITNYFGE